MTLQFREAKSVLLFHVTRLVKFLYNSDVFPTSQLVI